MQLTVQQPDLAQMFGQDSLFNTLYGMQRQDQATANNNQNLGQAQQDMQFQADQHPFDLQQAAANVGHTNALTGLTNAQIPGVQADSSMKTNAANADNAVPASVRNNAALNKYLATASADELKRHEAQATSDLYSGDPQKVTSAKLVLEHLPAINARLQEIRAEGANQASVAHIHESGATEREKMAEDAGKYNKNSSAYLMMKGFQGNFQQQAGAWTLKAMNDEEAGDTVGAARARQMADAARNADHDAKSAAAYTNLAKSPDFASLGIAPAVAPGSTAPRVPVNTPGPSELPIPGVVPPAAPQVAAPTKVPPKAGSKVMHGGKSYVFMGGDPANPANWKEQ